MPEKPSVELTPAEALDDFVNRVQRIDGVSAVKFSKENDSYEVVTYVSDWEKYALQVYRVEFQTLKLCSKPMLSFHVLPEDDLSLTDNNSLAYRKP